MPIYFDYVAVFILMIIIIWNVCIDRESRETDKSQGKELPSSSSIRQWKSFPTTEKEWKVALLVGFTYAHLWRWRSF